MCLSHCIVSVCLFVCKDLHFVCLLSDLGLMVGFLIYLLFSLFLLLSVCWSFNVFVLLMILSACPYPCLSPCFSRQSSTCIDRDLSDEKLIASILVLFPCLTVCVSVCLLRSSILKFLYCQSEQTNKEHDQWDKKPCTEVWSSKDA